jgi:uncharacterized protein YndB with AHSA1/START domain
MKTDGLAAPRSITDGDTILAVADVPLSPERAYRAFTTADLERWWGEPGLYLMREWSADLRPGGKWRVVIVRPDGGRYVAVGEFLELDPPRKLVMTRQYTWDHPTLGQRVTRVTHRFDALPTGTRATVRQDGFAGTAAAEEHAAGWARVLGYLQADAVRAGAPGAAEPPRVHAVSLGADAALFVAPSERERVRAFYGEVLGCTLTKSNDAVDVFQLGGDFYLATVYGGAPHRGAPLPPADAARAIWLELRAADPHALRARLGAFGVTQLETPDAAHLYFQAPGGQVFRVVGDDEDLSAWRR